MFKYQTDRVLLCPPRQLPTPRPSFNDAARNKSALPAGAQGAYEARAVKARLEAGIRR
jgi:hypothetical protein